MALSLSKTVDDGLSRLASKRMLPLVCAAILVQLVSVIGTQSQLAMQREQFGDDPLLADLVPEALPLAFEMPLGVAIGAWLLALIAAVTISIVAFRAFVAIETPGEPLLQTDGLVRGTVSGVAAVVLLSIFVTVGLIALIVPGLIIATLLLFTLPYVAAERTNALEAMARSYRLTQGSRLRVFGVLVILVVGFFSISLLGTIAFVLFGTGSVAGEVINISFSAVAWLFVLAALASAFEQLEEHHATREEKWDGIDDELLP